MVDGPLQSMNDGQLQSCLIELPEMPLDILREVNRFLPMLQVKVECLILQPSFRMGQKNYITWFIYCIFLHIHQSKKIELKKRLSEILAEGLYVETEKWAEGGSLPELKNRTFTDLS